MLASIPVVPVLERLFVSSNIMGSFDEIKLLCRDISIKNSCTRLEEPSEAFSNLETCTCSANTMISIVLGQKRWFQIAYRISADEEPTRTMNSPSSAR